MAQCFYSIWFIVIVMWATTPARPTAGDSYDARYNGLNTKNRYYSVRSQFHKISCSPDLMGCVRQLANFLLALSGL